MQTVQDKNKYHSIEQHSSNTIKCVHMPIPRESKNNGQEQETLHNPLEKNFYLLDQQSLYEAKL